MYSDNASVITSVIKAPSRSLCTYLPFFKLQLVAKLQEKNEELALRASRVSEQDLEEMRHEFEQRLAAADRKVPLRPPPDEGIM
jgi:uncharacterized protein YbgA (DUF1722 family)